MPSRKARPLETVSETLELILLGRGGQGVQTAGNQLARAFFDAGAFVQVFATYGGARRGMPVASALRVAPEPIRVRADITGADALLCSDDTLLEPDFLARGGERALVVVNSARRAEELPGLAQRRILPVDGAAIARETGLGRMVNAALLGALAAALGRPSLDGLCRVIGETAPAKAEQNIAACREAHRRIGSLAGGSAGGPGREGPG